MDLPVGFLQFLYVTYAWLVWNTGGGGYEYTCRLFKHSRVFAATWHGSCTMIPRNTKARQSHWPSSRKPTNLYALSMFETKEPLVIITRSVL